MKIVILLITFFPAYSALAMDLRKHLEVTTKFAQAIWQEDLVTMRGLKFSEGFNPKSRCFNFGKSSFTAAELAICWGKPNSLIFILEMGERSTESLRSLAKKALEKSDYKHHDLCLDNWLQGVDTDRIYNATPAFEKCLEILKQSTI